MKINITVVLLVIALAVAGCSATSNSTANQEASITSNQDNKLSTELELIVGTFKLEGTENVITASQAEQLVTLWQAYQTLSTSDTTASEELTALVKQIQSSMTTAQKDAIKAMNLTGQDMMAFMQEKGLVTFQTANGIVNGTPSPNQLPGEGFTIQQGVPSSSGGNYQPPSGGGPGQGAGGPPGGGFIIQGEFNSGEMDSNMSPEQLATAQASRGNRIQQSGMIPSALLNALIEYLQTK